MASLNLQLRSLETRLTPAGSVTSSVVGTTLTLTGTDQPDYLTIKDDGAGVTIVAFGGTFIDETFPQRTFAGPIDNIKILGLGGDDEVKLDDTVALNLSGFLDIDLGNGSTGIGNTFKLETTEAITLGRLRLKAGDGLDVATVKGSNITIAGDVNADFGNDAASLTIEPLATINGNLLMKSGAGATSLLLNGVVVKKNLTVLTGDGPSDIQLLGLTSVDGNAVVTGGKGDDIVILDGVNIGGPKGLSIKGGKGDTTFTAQGNGVSFTLGGLLVQSVDGAALLDVTTQLNSPGLVSVRGRDAFANLFGTLNAGTFSVNGVAQAAVSSFGSLLSVTTNATVLAKSGPASLTLVNADLDVGGNVLVNGFTDALLQSDIIVGRAENAGPQAVGAVGIAGNLTVRGGASASVAVESGFGSVGKNVLVQGGSDLTSFTSTGTMTYGGNLTLLGGSGPTVLDLTSFTTTVAKNLKVVGGSGSDNIATNGVTINGNVDIKTNGGGDTVSLDNRTIINGTTTINTGAGDDTLLLGQATGMFFNALSFNKKATIKTGAGNDQLTLGRSALAGGDDFSQASFAEGSVIDGGTNLNLFDSEASKSTGAPSIVNWTEPPVIV